MMSAIRCRSLVVSLLFAAAAALVWAIEYVGALSYQEQYQLFLWTGGYFASRIVLPGGLADWLAECLTQFNFLPALGAIIVAALFFAFQRLTWLVMKALGASSGWYGLSFLPVLLLWLYQSDPNVMPSLTVSLIAAEAAVYAIINKVMRLKVKGYEVDSTLKPYDLKTLKPSTLLNILAAIILLPLFYWLFGTAVYIVAGAILIETIRSKRSLFGLLAALYTVGFVYAMSYVLPYSESRLLIGLHYYRYPVNVPAMQWIVLAAALLVPYIAALFPRWRSLVFEIILLIAVFVAGGIAIRNAFNDNAHELIDYDYLVRTEQWDAIISKAEKKQPSSPMSVSIVNLALSQRGLLLERLFHFYQNGGEGLFPTFSRDILSPVSTAEIFFRLGMVNDCERYCFEAMQSIPDFQRSGRLLKRITQCEVANGQYEVARRYLLQLSRSTFYSAWAKKTLAMLGNENLINDDPTYVRLRGNREQHSDYLFSEREMDQMTGLLLMNNPKNRMAYEYLIAYELLQRDLQHFSEYYILGQNIDYQRLPTVVQEVLIGQWLQTHRDLRGIPFSVEPSVVNSTVDFIRAYMANRNDARLKQPPMCYNAWRYLLK